MTPPDALTLRSASLVSLDRHPETPQAQAFVAALLPIIVPHMDRGRLGSKGLASLTGDLGAILAGIMRPGLQGVPVRAQASSSGSMWEGQGIGRDRFWRVVDAMAAAGLVERLAGVKTPGMFGDFGGKATALWPSERLVGLAREAGCTVETRKADWRADATLSAKARTVTPEALVRCRPLKGVPMVLSPEMLDEMGAMRRDLQAINAANAAVDIRGAGHTVTMVRRFVHSPMFGGRFYAPHSTLPPGDRARITMGGEATVEVDVTASQLTILLGIVGQPAHGDPYAFDGIPREVVKQFMLQTLGGGAVAGGWSRRGGREGWPSTRAVWQAVRPRYGFLEDLPSLLPMGTLDGLPQVHHGWAAGQWLVRLEAEAIGAAVDYCVARGVPVLPVHDSLIVPKSAAGVARAALQGAYLARCGVLVNLKG